jgi:hypothetical protein
MNAQMFEQVRAIAQRCFIAAALVLLIGCSAAKKEEDGDPEANIGEYRVTVLPAESNLYVDADGDTVTVQLKVECQGPFLPDDCATSSPDWEHIYTGKDGFPGTITIVNPFSPNTTATIRFDTNALKARRSPQINSLGNRIYVERISFRPSRVPNDLVVTGRDWTYVRVELTVPPAERQEQNPNEPRLKIAGLAGGIISFNPRLNEPAQILTLPMIYSGLGTTITVSGPTDLGEPSGAAKFTLLSPRTITLPGDGTQPPSLRVRYEVPQEDLFTYTAGLFITVGNNRPIPIRLQGRRENF